MTRGGPESEVAELQLPIGLAHTVLCNMLKLFLLLFLELNIYQARMISIKSE